MLIALITICNFNVNITYIEKFENIGGFKFFFEKLPWVSLVNIMLVDMLNPNIKFIFPITYRYFSKDPRIF